MEYTKLNNGLEMPMLGYGVYQTPPEETQRCVEEALEVGYRLIDTAQSYENEVEVGLAIQHSAVPREEVFITSKIWIANMTYERAKASIDESLEKLRTDHLDLMLLHQAMGDYPGAYRALEDAYHEGKLKAIGVSNFYPERLVDVCYLAEVVPAVNQIETHPFRQQAAAHANMVNLGVQHQAWAPFAEGQNNLFANPLLAQIGEKYGKTPGQIALRALIQQGIAVIPKTVHRERMAENFSVFDFALDESDMATFATLDDAALPPIFDHFDIDLVKWLLDKRVPEEQRPLY